MGQNLSEIERRSETECAGNRRGGRELRSVLMVECWPVLRRKCRNEVDRHSSEVRGEEVSCAGQRVMKDWGSGRLETLQPSDEGTYVQGVGSGRVDINPDLSPTTRTWVLSGKINPLSPIEGPKETRRDGGPGLMIGSMDLKKKGMAASDFDPDAGPSYGREDPDQGGKIKEGPKSPAAQEVMGFLLKCSASNYPPEAETFVARESEDTRKLQGVVKLTETDRALEEESMRYGMGSGGEFFDHSGNLDEEGRADNSMWLTVYEACNERIKECKELGVIKGSSDKGSRGMEGVGDIYDAQVERSELEGKWEESGLARFSQFLGFPTEGLEKEILNFLTKIRKRREKIHSKELLEKSKLGTGQRAPNCDCPMKVKILSWNVREANDSSKRKVIKTFIRNQRVDLMCIQETKLQCMTDSIARSIGSGRFLGWKAVNAEGASGGIFICWDRRSLDMLDWEEGQFTLSCRFRNVENGIVWVFTGVYGPFSKGGDFTWNGGLNNQTWARLDRFLVSPSWIDQFNGINQCRLARPVSDHFPIMLAGGGIRRGPSPFRFENMWLKTEGFKELVRSWWQGTEVRGNASYKLATKMKEIKQKLKVWNREEFGKLECNKSAALQQVEFWDREENERILTMEESELKKEAKENYRK
ncbi:hypothetical protein CK203_074199 [Vitis vinifera]|uniref:Endonuclease/exonuclease/phosphatase domain-containing protein n=1 Tax=Vitis vinifera TaxID=29760 RepID=A0A438DTI6_VITVI|nr:hypothetical protein CK203_074199 [Vitis vinifera]